VKREIVINASPLEARVALLEDGSLTEFYLERGEHRGLAGNIYKGKVTRVLPGMQAAFVDIGLDKAGFLHVSDFRDAVETFGSAADVIGDEDVESDSAGELSGGQADSEIEIVDEAAPSANGAAPEGRRSRGGRGRRRRRPQAGRSRAPIEHQLRRSQEIIVQIAKEPMGTKGARLTSSISIPGRHLVFMPMSNHLGISRRISSAEERTRLRNAVNEIRPSEGGFIIRTACEGVSNREIQNDVQFLTKLWASILLKSETTKPASMLYNDLDLALRTVRDLFSSDVEKLWCDDEEVYERIVQFVQTYMPRLRSRVTLYDGAEPLFDRFKIESQIERALDSKVELKSGGYLVIDHAEALTAIDVNTGRFVGKRDQEETVVKTNLEAADEVVKQLRLRNIGGIIVVDFIDMARESDRKRVTDVLAEALKRDRARATMSRISDLGLVQMSRKRTRESLEALLTDPCPRCHGRRVVKSIATLAAEVLRGIYRDARRRRAGDMVIAHVNPEIARYLYDVGAPALENLEHRLRLKIVLRSKESLEAGSFELAQAPAAA
jgi:ribonuclease G